MTTRHPGKRVEAKKTPISKRTSGYRNCKKYSGHPQTSAASKREQRGMVQLLICGSLFIILVALKLVIPSKMERVNDRLSQALHQNMDIQSVFSAVGRTFSGEMDGKEVIQAVFSSEEQKMELDSPTSFQVRKEPKAALRLLQQCRNTELTQATQEEDREAVSTLAYIQYSNQNVPENVSLEQAILGFEYCTPICGTLTSEFGYREHPVAGEQRFHYGIDLAADQGTSIRCFADGTVTAVGESSSYGKYCIVDHGDGFETLYAHCSQIEVSSGADIDRGEKIGEVGTTGIATGPHLHFELHRDGIYLNPVYYVET